jgi:hypothetical protein
MIGATGEIKNHDKTGVLEVVDVEKKLSGG